MKSLEAILRGYVLFDVNGKRFLLYTPACNYRKSILDGDLCFKGFHLYKRWLGFYERFSQ